MVSLGGDFPQNILWHFRLRPSLDPLKKELRYFCGSVVHRRSDLWATDWPSALWRIKEERCDGENPERTIAIIQVDKNKIEYPIEIPIEAKELIEALVQKDPALRPRCQDILKFRFFTTYLPKGGKSKKMMQWYTIFVFVLLWCKGSAYDIDSTFS